MLHFNESLEKIAALSTETYKTKTLFLLDSLGYVLAEDIIADHNSPELPTSAMDGYALKYEDMVLKRLKIASINPAGSVLQDEVLGGTCGLMHGKKKQQLWVPL